MEENIFQLHVLCWCVLRNLWVSHCERYGCECGEEKVVEVWKRSYYTTL